MMKDDQTTGTQLRDAGIADAIAADAAVHRDFRHYVDVALAGAIAAGSPFDADDVRSRLPEDVAARMTPALLGAVMQHARRDGRIAQLGWRTSSRPSRHAGALRLWISTSTAEHDWTAAA